ncbi:MAG: hypothetical protein KDB68_15560 [Planctomycetes bacterium]|nr:hypothetical protein [Planctomycetota bacterium]MCA8946033.1 hypothetical protein [Planctomycetota bacterium]
MRSQIDGDRLRDAEAIKQHYESNSGDPDQVLWAFLNALLLLEENANDAMAACAVMMREADRRDDRNRITSLMPSRMREQSEFYRLKANKLIARSYVGGDGPPEYALADEGKISVDVKSKEEAGPGLLKYFIWSSGKDNATPVKLREVNGAWVWDEWSSITTGVRK